jgi:pimeloyl-ACP methyl ester carboxylesterase
MQETDTQQYYVKYFQDPGIAEAELSRNVRTTVRTLLWAASGDAGPRGEGCATPVPFGMISKAGILRDLPVPAKLPKWLTERDVEVYSNQLESSGFKGGLNWYRNMDYNWEMLAFLDGRKIEVPALFIVGERDLVLQFPGMKGAIESLPARVPLLQSVTVLEGCGHWTQQERPYDVTAAILTFLEGSGSALLLRR